MSLIDEWFAARGWTPLAFQREVWAAYAAGKSGLIHAPTGQGKTLAAWLGPVAEELERSRFSSGKAKPSTAGGLRVLWITPLRALAVDTAQALREPLAGLKSGKNTGSSLDWEVETRTGDTPQKTRTKLKKSPPAALVTTPESLSVMLSYPDARERLTGVRAVIVDEWHELLSTKRGVQTELCLARLRAWNPSLRVWGLSATIGNLEEALRVLLGENSAAEGVVIAAGERRELEIHTLAPPSMERFPWSGQLGLRMVPAVAEQVDKAASTLIFTNTRSQTEVWFQALLDHRPDWRGQLAMHHGSLEKSERLEVEERLRQGRVKCVVCTSSLDLGVDFSPVDQVLQIGSPKSVARLVQRAGRGGHRPGVPGRIVGVPTSAFDLVEFAATREALRLGRIEARRPLRRPLDVLVQHLTTVAAGGGFTEPEMRREVESAFAFHGLEDQEWEWALGFITTGGRALRAYPQYQKVTVESGVYAVRDERIAKLHRLNIGTISGDQAVSVQYAGGKKLGTVEEWFISKVKPGGLFIFGGRRLELVRCQDMKAVVKDAAKTKKHGQIPSWQGMKAPLSGELALAVGRKLVEAGEGRAGDPEMRTVAPVLELQKAWSVIPKPEELLIEETESRDGRRVYVYPFAGRLVHEGLGTLVAWRLTRRAPGNITVSFNDYGFELFSPSLDLRVTEAEWRELFSVYGLLDDLLACMNTTELAKRRFREIARVAGLVVQGYPGNPKSTKALQVSSGLLYDVFAKYDPGNLLLEQARREILERQLEVTRLGAAMEELRERKIVRVGTERLTPFAFPLWAGRMSASLTEESFTGRLERMLAELERAADEPGALGRPPEILTDRREAGMESPAPPGRARVYALKAKTPGRSTGRGRAR